ncbi:hypothetical protein AWB77_06084 [Caballeronia fortuita]|uniref:Lipoprotein n=1 Tax=Caballeronia fortuita TaxID=1777138 RepID=A0A158E2G8_9BURK|nr:hypothetical protein [Caballeronia fortuita]SAL00117.1 hypothetical protein AWB77_06084 [Caballeronia fortuita]
MKLAAYAVRACLIVASFNLLGSTAAIAGGNGNGGNGSGGSHGAATSGMTYHSEPVSSPWNRPYDQLAKSANRREAEATAEKPRETEQHLSDAR